jgi:hypothetical protein
MKIKISEYQKIINETEKFITEKKMNNWLFYSLDISSNVENTIMKITLCCEYSPVLASALAKENIKYFISECGYLIFEVKREDFIINIVMT